MYKKKQEKLIDYYLISLLTSVKFWHYGTSAFLKVSLEKSAAKFLAWLIINS